ncbi:MAG: hypothetical protein M1830_007374 [Pleopsidium flavum]|nr:MAG: hypothetical protein M1830_007374 [Pleopsidium flavum]
MAFRQPTHAPSQRQLSIHVPAEPIATTLSTTHQQRAVEESQEWVLFSPSLAPSTSRTHTTSTERTPRTAGLSRVSDFGSFDTVARSGDLEDEAVGSDVLEEDAEEDEELDSLDDGLHAFHEPSVYHTTSRRLDQSGGSILPTHDGLGTFPASSSPVQDQLWQFEQFNPRRRLEGHHRRRSSIQRRLDAGEDGHDIQVENERMQRIEQWRMEQSRVLLDEIEKETRRRRLSQSGKGRMSDAMDVGEEERSTVGASKTLTADHPNSQDAPQSGNQEREETEPLWQRITRRVIRDLMGIDESILSVIFGESLPPDDANFSPHPSITLSSQNSALPTDITAPIPGRAWEDRLLERVARELGILVHQISEHPGAFSTYLTPSQPPADYAGIPITRSSPPRAPTQNSIPYDSGNLDSTDFPQFNPTLQNVNTSATTHAALWGIEEEFPDTEDARFKLERDYWERELDIRTVFRFLRNRFTNAHRPSSGTGAISNSLAISSTQETARRAAIIRQHHPLISRIHDRQSRRTSLLHHHNHHAQLKRPGSSCASASTKKSAKRGSGSSRNYWDIGGSVGSGSAIAATGGMGFWGEV